MVTDIKQVLYNAKYFWDKSLNANATIDNCLPNCTTLVYGAVLEDGHLPLVKTIRNAKLFDTVLINGWSAIPYDKSKLEVGDVIEWQSKNHVAIVSRIDGNKKIVSASFYTGQNGKSTYDGTFDKRDRFTSLKEVSDYMYKNYPTRYFHCWDIDEENKWVGGLPQLILKHPLYSVKRNINKNQIEVLTFEQNVRNGNDEILCKAEKGYFNVLSQKEYNGYVWYEVEKNKYIAGVNGRVNYLPKSNNIEKENQELKEKIKVYEDKLNKIKEILEV